MSTLQCGCIPGWHTWSSFLLASSANNCIDHPSSIAFSEGCTSLPGPMGTCPIASPHCSPCCCGFAAISSHTSCTSHLRLQCRHTLKVDALISQSQNQDAIPSLYWHKSVCRRSSCVFLRGGGLLPGLQQKRFHLTHKAPDFVPSISPPRETNASKREGRRKEGKWGEATVSVHCARGVAMLFPGLEEVVTLVKFYGLGCAAGWTR